MKKVWLITNPRSGSATPEKCAALEALFEERGLSCLGRTDFPDTDLPDAHVLNDRAIDTVILFAGDGTINAALCKLAQWDGAFLILPGGTMNLLSRELHGDAGPHAIVHTAHESDRRMALPYVEAGPHRAFVALILGPAASWARAREAARAHRMRRMWRAVRHALLRTFGRGVRVDGAPGLGSDYQAVFVQPKAGGLDVAAVDARDWRSLAELGWDWLTGDWIAARAVATSHADRLAVRGTKPALALFDGEPVTLDPALEIRSGITPRNFIVTREEDI